jgi:hypothetical protein
MKFLENRRTNYQFIALLIHFKKILFPTQLQDNYKPLATNKIIMYKRKNRNCFPITWLETELTLF